MTKIYRSLIFLESNDVFSFFLLFIFKNTAHFTLFFDLFFQLLKSIFLERLMFIILYCYRIKCCYFKYIINIKYQKFSVFVFDNWGSSERLRFYLLKWECPRCNWEIHMNWENDVKSHQNKACLTPRISILVNASIYFNCDFDFIFFILTHNPIINW